ncbi:hypothetical protein MKX01_023389, partial [Papaver californicum]
MAICSQRIGLSGGFGGKCDSVKQRKTAHLIVKVRAFQSLGRNGVLGNLVNEVAFSNSRNGRYIERKEKQGFRVWNSLQENMGPESSESPVVAIPKEEGKDSGIVKEIDDSEGVKVNPVVDNGNGDDGNWKAGGRGGGGGNGG